ncbi:carbohydrate-binding module family 1 protein [Hypholoma sublateritium FD-334 SS-4]|uniref:Carbohydrate-binding module family 1 protein n=1 Tax=Hypholoma sublateritium (strain FD-334 SS-4) TaxID=945553 RepID=A0A0D2KYG1_HYPSF|nr:carbohydrate-binding module family 1 protein [Hypholoma sublateritium FD-334 SS-4]
MRLFPFSVAFFAISVAAVEMYALVDVNAVLGFDTGPDNFYNAPTPPWVVGATPGWYYGPNPQKYPDLWCLHEFMCRLLWYYPNALHCPTPLPYPPPPPVTTTDTVTSTKTTTTTATTTVTDTSTTTATKTTTTTITAAPTPIDGYIETFDNITAAVQADDFLTFGLVETVADCMAMCDSVPGCTFVNSFHDVNGKGGSTDLTCSLFSFCHTTADADNAGGQSQPDGSIDFIINSDGWCKVGNGTLPTSTSSSSSAATPTTTTLPSTSTTTAASTSTPTTTTTSTSKSTSSSTTKTSTTSTKTTSTKTTTPAPTGTGIAHYYQCGGIGYIGSTICIAPYQCVVQNPYYSQCI